jgi:F0F1-type ATP synthase assembly protein I
MSRPPGNSGGDAKSLALISTAVAQMVVPILVGVWLDDRYGWSPWGLVAGTVLGFGGGFASLVWVSRKQNRHGGTPPSDT